MNLYIKNLSNLNSVLNEMGWKLYIRPHPAGTNIFKEAILNNGLVLSSEKNLEDDVASHYASIGINSAALIGIINSGYKLLLLEVPYAPKLPEHMISSGSCVKSTIKKFPDSIKKLVNQPIIEKSNKGNIGAAQIIAKSILYSELK